MRILVFEDELHNFRMLKLMLEEIVPGCEVLGPMASVRQGREYLAAHRDMDLIIADIRLGDGLSFEALRQAPEEVPIIFTTAYDNHALKAFEYNSLSYLLKPVDSDELAEAVRKAGRLHGPANPGAYLPADGGDFRERLVVKTPGGEKVIPVSNVLYFYSEDKYSYARTRDSMAEILDMSLESLAGQLDPARFLKVSRRHIVAREHVTGTERLPGGRERILIGGAPDADIPVSRERRRDVSRWLHDDRQGTKKD